MANNPNVQLDIIAHDLATKIVAGVERRILGLGTGIKKFGSIVGGVFSTLNQMVGGFGGIIAAIGFGKLFSQAIAEASQAEISIEKLRMSLDNLGLDADKLVPHLDGAIDKLAALGHFDNDDVREGLAQLITISGDVAGSYERLGLVVDLAAAKHMSVADAADVVGRAMTGQTRALRQFGITTKDSTVGLDLLTAKLRGAAELNAGTFEGSVRRLRVAFGNALEMLGMFITENQAVRGAITNTSEAFEAFSRNTARIELAIHRVVSTLQLLKDFITIVFYAIASVVSPIALTVASLFRGIAAAGAEAVVLLMETFNFINKGLNLALAGFAKLTRTTALQLPTYDANAIRTWRDKQVKQIADNGKFVIGAWKGLGTATGTAFSNARKNTTRSDELIARRDMLDRGVKPFGPAVPPGKLPGKKPGAGGDDKEDKAAQKAEKERQALETARIERLGMLAQRESTRKDALRELAVLEDALTQKIAAGNFVGKTEAERLESEIYLRKQLTAVQQIQEQAEKALLDVLGRHLLISSEREQAIVDLIVMERGLNAAIATNTATSKDAFDQAEREINLRERLAAVQDLLDKATAQTTETLKASIELKKIEAITLLEAYELRVRLEAAIAAETSAINAGNGSITRRIELIRQLNELDKLGVKPPDLKDTNDVGPASQLPGLPDELKASLPENRTPEVTVGNELAKQLLGVGDSMDEIIGKSDELRRAFALTAASGIQEFANTALDAFEQVGAGQLSLAQGLGQAVRAGVAAAARSQARYYAIKALAALGEGFLGNPLAFAAAAKFGAAAAAFSLLAGAVGGGNGGASGGNASRGPSGNDISGRAGREPVRVDFPKGSFTYDANDPKTVAAFKKFFEDLMDREVIVTVRG
jgi:hypothetical protein